MATFGMIQDYKTEALVDLKQLLPAGEEECGVSGDVLLI